jgi:uncharacterized protein (TIGR03437 family)
MWKLPGSMASYFAKAILICGCVRLAGQAIPTATWTGGGGDSNWGNANNWSWQGDNGQCKGYAPGAIPALPGDICYAPNVVIPSGVVVNENNVQFISNINNFSIGQNSVLAGGGVDTEGNVMVASDAFVNGAVTSRGGALSNQGTIIGSVLAVMVNNSGTIKLAGAVDQAFATTQGTNTGTIEATSNGSTLGVQGASTLQGPWNNANGTIQVDSGATLVCNGATVTGGNFNVSTGGTVTTSGNGLTLAGTVNSTSFVIDVVGSLGTAPVTITGTLLMAGNLIVGNTTGVSTLNVNNGGVLNVNGGNTILGAQAGATGQLEISGTSALPTTTGNLIIGAAGTGYVAVYGGANLTARTITLGSAPSGSGQLNVNGGVVNYATLNAQHSTANPAVWVYGGGTLEGQANQTIGGAPADFLGVSALITSSGSAWKPQSGVTIQTGGSLTVSFGGAVNVTCPSCIGTTSYVFQANANSTVDIFGTKSSLTVAGDLGLSAGATLTVESGAMAYSPKVYVRGTAMVQGMDSLLMATQPISGFNYSGGSIYIADAGTLTVQNQGQVTSDSITLNGPAATMTAQSSGGVKTSRLDVSAGGALIQNAGHLSMSVEQAPGFILVGDATWPGVLTVSDSANLSGAGSVQVAKNGTLRITNGDSVIIQGLGVGHVSMLPGTPPATIDVSNGALGIGNVFPLSTGDQDTVPRGTQPAHALAVVRQGWVAVGPSGYLSGGEICNATSSGATKCTGYTLVNAAGQLLVNGSVVIEGGTVQLDPTTLNITQDFQQSSGTLDLQIQGTQSGEYDRITAGGSIQIPGGTVEFDFINGFAPGSGDKFNLLSAPSGISTSGASLTTTGLASGFKYTTSASSGQFDLTATNNGTATTSAPAPPPAPTLTSVDAASGATQLAPGSLASGYGAGLATGQPASAPYIWPATISGTSVSIVDATGATTQAPLLYVSSTEVNYQIPDDVGLGAATVTLTAGDGTTKSGPINVVSYAPGLFTVNSAGLSASFADCVAANGAQTTIATSQVVNGALVAVPLNLKACQQTILELWATGLDEAEASMVQATIGGLDATVLYAGPQGVYPGVDQINVVIPQSLAGAGKVPIVVSAGGVTSNTVNVTFQ